MQPDNISVQARKIHFSGLVFDAHVDTPQRLLFDHFDLAPRDNEGCIDIPRMREGGIGAVFFALWVPVDITGAAATQRVFDLLDAVEKQVTLHEKDLSLATTSETVRKTREQDRIAILLGVEGGHAINNDLEVLRVFAARGVRYMTLTHNSATDWADSSNQSPRHHGLTEFGKQVVREMNRLGMVVDVSHVSDETFRDVIEVSRSPVMASHSCCRTICNAPRNMTDQMIQEMAARGGVIHITFHDAFLSQQYADASKAMVSQGALEGNEITAESPRNEARKLIEGQRTSDQYIKAGKLPQVYWEKIIEHIDHVVRLVGADHVGLGSDFDGAFMPEGMRDAASFPKFTEALLRRGFAERDIRNMLGENTLRVVADAEQIARQ